MTTVRFHLGKKSVTYGVDEEKDILLFGQKIHNNNSCVLELRCIEVDTGEDTIPEHASENEVLLKQYSARSNKFKTGQATVFDAGRYIKSRYRDIFDHLKTADEADRRGIIHSLTARITETELNEDDQEESNDTFVQEMQELLNNDEYNQTPDNIETEVDSDIESTVRHRGRPRKN